MESPHLNCSIVSPGRTAVAARLRAGRAAALVVAAVGAACGGKDPYAPVAQYNTVDYAFVLYPMRTVVAPQNSALDLHAPAPTRPAVYVSSVLNAVVPNFDVAFDVDNTGHPVLLPPKLVTSAQILPRTGFQTSSTLFDSLKAAPGGTYQADSAFRVTTGQTVVVQAQGTACSVASPFYSRLVVDSIGAATGALYIRARIDPNCGFKSFASGVPSS